MRRAAATVAGEALELRLTKPSASTTLPGRTHSTTEGGAPVAGYRWRGQGRRCLRRAAAISSLHLRLLRLNCARRHTHGAGPTVAQ